MNQQKWFRLIDLDPLSSIGRGSLLQFFDESWRAEQVILMICETFGNSDFPYSLVRLTGSKSGICPMQLLPSPSSEKAAGLNVGWLIDNWDKWIWPDSNINDVWIRFDSLLPEEFMIFPPGS